MQFKFKRKYTNLFMLAIVLHAIVLAFFLFFPTNLLKSLKQKQTITLVALVISELIIIFYLSLFRKKYFVYHDHLVVKRLFLKRLTIKYINIIKTNEKMTDTIFFNFGRLPSFKIYYKNERERIKRVVIRADNTSLLLSIIKNEVALLKIK